MTHLCNPFHWRKLDRGSSSQLRNCVSPSYWTLASSDRSVQSYKQKMRANFLFVFVVNSLLVVSDSNVAELNLKNFDEYVDGERFVFVFFYAAWHEQCQKILVRYDEVANAFDGRDDVIIAKVNAYEEIKLATKYWVDRYPTFRYFIKGSVTEET